MLVTPLNEWVTLLQTVGFPIFMCFWFMFRMETLIKNNTAALLRFMREFDSLESTTE